MSLRNKANKEANDVSMDDVILDDDMPIISAEEIDQMASELDEQLDIENIEFNGAKPNKQELEIAKQLYERLSKEEEIDTLTEEINGSNWLKAFLDKLQVENSTDKSDVAEGDDLKQENELQTELDVDVECTVERFEPEKAKKNVPPPQSEVKIEALIQEAKPNAPLTKYTGIRLENAPKYIFEKKYKSQISEFLTQNNGRLKREDNIGYQFSFKKPTLGKGSADLIDNGVAIGSVKQSNTSEKNTAETIVKLAKAKGWSAITIKTDNKKLNDAIEQAADKVGLQVFKSQKKEAEKPLEVHSTFDRKM